MKDLKKKTFFNDSYLEDALGAVALVSMLAVFTFIYIILY